MNVSKYHSMRMSWLHPSRQILINYTQAQSAKSLGLTIADWVGKVQVGNGQEKAQSERISHSKNRGGKN